MDNLVITVARGFGSCGKRIAKQIADDLGIHCYENRILMLASQMSGLDEEVFAEVNEKLRSQNVFSAFLKGLPMQRSPKVEDRKFISDEKLFEYQKQIIEQLADTESCVIVGKCADWILKDRPNVISLYIEAHLKRLWTEWVLMKQQRQGQLHRQINTVQNIMNIIQAATTGLTQ